MVYRTLLEEIPMVEVITTVHFPDVAAIYFRSLLDFLYSGQTCVSATDVEHLHDLLDLLQIQPGVWRTGNKADGGEKVEVLTRSHPGKNDQHAASVTPPTIGSRTPLIDINSNEGAEAAKRRRNSECPDTLSSLALSPPPSLARISVKRERLNESSGDDDRDDLDDDIEEEILDKKNYISSSHHEHLHHHHQSHHQPPPSSHLHIRRDDDELERLNDSRENDACIEDDDDDVDGRSDIHDRRKCAENTIPRDMIGERRRSSSDPVNLSLGMRDRDDDSNDGHIDVETIGTAPNKVISKIFLKNYSQIQH